MRQENYTLEGTIHETEKEKTMIKHFIKYTGVLTLDFLSTRTQRNRLLLLLNHFVYGILLQYHENSKTKTVQYYSINTLSEIPNMGMVQ